MTDLEEKLQKELNAEQFNAATHMEGPAVIVAGAGSGKTHTLISRIEHLVDEGVTPERIIMLTFTNAAADEMKERASLVNDKCSRVVATTYHKFCSMMLRKYHAALGFDANFETLTPMKYKTLIEYVKSNSKYDAIPEFPSASKLATIYSQAINLNVSIREIVANTPYHLYGNEIDDLYQEIKTYSYINQKFNFDDLLVYMNDLLDMNEFCKKIAKEFDYLMVDEFQDTNELQLNILKKLSNYNENIVVVGDVSQSIYKFRGAQSTNIKEFAHYFKDYDIYVLTTNYRSSQEILNVANKMMRSNNISWDYIDMVADNKNGERPQVIQHFDVKDQCDWIINKIEEFVSNGYNLHDIAIIERKSMSSFKLENELQKRQIKFEKRGGLKFTDYQCVDEMISFLSVVSKKFNKFEWFNVLKLIPGVGNKAAADIADDLSTKNDLTKYEKRKFWTDLTELLKYIETWKQIKDLNILFDSISEYYFAIREAKIDMSTKMTNSAKFDAKDKIKRDKQILSVLKDMSAAYKSTTDFLEDIALDTLKKDNEDDNSDKLIITTIHSAKGLEWKAVILLDCINYEIDDDEEELRCWYVAITRAMDNLIISLPSTMMINGRMQDVYLNPLVEPALLCCDII